MTISTLELIRNLPTVHPTYRQEAWFQSPIYYPIYTSIASIVMPTTIIEIGTLQGFSLIALLNGCFADRVFWIDNEQYLQGSNAMCIRNLSYFIERTGRKAPYTGFGENPKALLQLKDELKKNTNTPIPVTLMHIDGEHSYMGKLRDLAIADELCPDILLIDDYDSVPECRAAVASWANPITYLPTFRGLAVHIYNDQSREDWLQQIKQIQIL